MTDETPVTLREAAALVGRPVGTVRQWAAHRRMRPLYRLRNRDYYRPADVRAAAASIGPRGRRYREREPTAEEVERTVAEQMRPENLPSWWPAHAERQRRRAGGVRIVRVAARVPTDARDFSALLYPVLYPKKRKAG